MLLEMERQTGYRPCHEKKEKMNIIPVTTEVMVGKQSSGRPSKIEDRENDVLT